MHKPRISRTRKGTPILPYLRAFKRGHSSLFVGIQEKVSGVLSHNMISVISGFQSAGQPWSTVFNICSKVELNDHTITTSNNAVVEKNILPQLSFMD